MINNTGLVKNYLQTNLKVSTKIKNTLLAITLEPIIRMMPFPNGTKL
jgi:hypothetical protein